MIEHEHVHEHSHGHPHVHGHVHDPEQTKKISNRLARAIGHLESIKKMVEDDRDCSEVLISRTFFIGMFFLLHSGQKCAQTKRGKRQNNFFRRTNL